MLNNYVDILLAYGSVGQLSKYKVDECRIWLEKMYMKSLAKLLEKFSLS